MELCMSLCCAPKQEIRQKLTLHKKCPHCGAITDIADWYNEWGDLPFSRAICWFCKKFLYATEKGQKIVMTRYKHIYLEYD